MKKLLALLIIPLFIFGQETTLVGDVDCDGQITSEDASLILQFITTVIDTLPCETNMIGLTPEQLEEMITMMNGQVDSNSIQVISMIGPMYMYDEFPNFINYHNIFYNTQEDNMFYLDALRFCSKLVYGGFDDWGLPHMDQIQNYIKNYPLEELVITNNTESSDLWFWTMADFKNHLQPTDSPAHALTILISGTDNSYPHQAIRTYNASLYNGAVRCFCVR